MDEIEKYSINQIAKDITVITLEKMLNSANFAEYCLEKGLSVDGFEEVVKRIQHFMSMIRAEH